MCRKKLLERTAAMLAISIVLSLSVSVVISITISITISTEHISETQLTVELAEPQIHLNEESFQPQSRCQTQVKHEPSLSC